jgi:hypothetical protein
VSRARSWLTNERAGRLYQSRGFVYTGEEHRSGVRIERVMRLTLAAPLREAAQRAKDYCANDPEARE